MLYLSMAHYNGALLIHRQYHAAKQPIPFEACRALLRLGRKYEIQTLFNEAVSRLKRDIPTSLAEYDKMSIPNDWTEFVSTPTLLYQIAEFCQRSCIPEIRCALPLIYFWCCSQDVVSGPTFLVQSRSPPQTLCFVAR